MGFVSRLRSAPRIRASYAPDDDFWYRPAGAGTYAPAGIPVTPELAMTLSAFWKGVRLIAETCGSLPFVVYRQLENGGKEKARDHPLYDVLRWQPNAEQTAMEYWERMVYAALLRGVAYSEIREGPRGFADQLIPLNPDRMKVERIPAGARWRYTDADGKPRTYTRDELFMISGPMGLSVIQYGAQSLGGALAADNFAARFFRQGAAPAFAVTHPAELGEEGMANLHTSITRYVAGLERAHGVLILEEGAKPETLGISAEDAQLLATREYGIEEVARWLNMPASMLGSSKTPTYASHAAFQIDLLTFTYRPWHVRIEQATRRDLILAPDVYVAEFITAALMRMDPQARSAFYESAIARAGWLNRNEVRQFENMNPEDGLDEFWAPLNMGSSGGSSAAPASTGASAQPPASPGASMDPPAIGASSAPARDVRSSFWSDRAAVLARSSAERLVRKELAAIETAARRYASDPDGWRTWVRGFYEDHAALVASTLQIRIERARAYAAEQGSTLEEGGVAVCQDWPWTAVNRLARVALDERAA